MLEPPKRIGPYQVLGTLGSGGMGTVFEVRHPKFARNLALKVLNTRAASERALTRFWREAEYMARIRHPGVVAIHQLGRSPEGPYIVEDLVEGRALNTVADDGFPPERAAEIARDLALALEAVHAAGILHRDLKPGNVVLNEQGKPVLLDFGLARDVNAEQLTRTGEMVGTPAYMSPEQARGMSPKLLGPQVDVYGLGAILFHLATGRQPFESAALLQAIVQVLSEEPNWPSASGAEIPELEAILKVSMAKDPADRYATMAEFRQDLDRFLRGEDTRAASRIEHLVRRKRRKRTYKAGGVLLLLFGLPLGFWGLWEGLAPPPLPVATVAPVATSAESAAPKFSGLWKLPPKTIVRFRAEYEESESVQTISLGVWFVATTSAAPNEKVRLDVTIEAASIGFGSSMMGGGGFEGRWDSRVPTPGPLKSIGQGVGQRFSLVLDPDSGAITELHGVDAIGALVRRDILEGDGRGIPNFANTVGVAFTDSFIGSIFETLIHVREAPAIPWSEQEQALREGRRFGVGSLKPQQRALRTLSPVYHYDESHVFRVQARADYKFGLLRASTASQELLGTLSRRGNVTEIGTYRLTGKPVTSETSWGVYLRQDGEPLLSDYGSE